MRIVLISILLFVSIQVFSQRKISFGFSPIPQSQFDSCKQLLTILPFKPVDSLELPLDGTEIKFQVLRSEAHPGVSILEATNRLLLVTDSTGIAENLIGRPLFTSNSMLFASFGYSPVYRRQMLQIGEIVNGVIDAHLYIRPPQSIIIQELGCVSDGKVYLKDTVGKFWICNYKVE